MDPRTLTLLRKLVHDRTGVVLDEGKEYLVETRLASIARDNGFESVEALCSRLRLSSPALVSSVVEAMTTNETSFFRDHHPFEALRRIILPELLAKRAHERTLRIWCAACSTGQEPYSLAMMLDENFPQLLSWNVRIYATDVSKTVLARARSGRYGQIEVNRGLCASMLVKYFIRDGLEWELRPEIRRRVAFDELNLVNRWPVMEKYDLIFLRNVLIYFDQSTRLGIMQRIGQHLRPDGYLLLGGSETPPQGISSFERLPIERAGIYRIGPSRPSEANHAR